jgi:hypothetical protein
MDELTQMWGQVADEAAVKTKRDEWDRLLRVVYRRAATSSSSGIPTSRLWLECSPSWPSSGRPRANEAMPVITGQAFQRLGIENLVEEDFFAWINEPAVNNRG